MSGVEIYPKNSISNLERHTHPSTTACMLSSQSMTADKPSRSPFSSLGGCAALKIRIAARQGIIPMRILQHACCQAHRITFQLTSWLADYTETADKPSRSPFSSPCGCAALDTRIAASLKCIPMQALQSTCCQARRITFQLTSWLAACSQTPDKPRRSPFGSTCGCAAPNTSIAASQ